VGKGACERSTEKAKRGYHAQEDDVSRRPPEDCRRSKDAVGEGEGCTEEDRLKAALGSMG
jgi:hypothetical protein